MRGGVLIIGSLLWDNEARAAWRSRLSLDERVPVRAPIRYGRRSEKRGNTFTMVFASGEAMGQAILVPFARPATDVAALLAEAEALWSAESSSTGQQSLGAKWGCVGALFHPGRASDGIRGAWAQAFRVRRVAPVAPVDHAGELHIEWPCLLTNGQPAGVDVILATATLATDPPPAHSEVARAWAEKGGEHERYFFENVRHGIRTPHDRLLWKTLKRLCPAFLADKRYAEAVAILEAQDGDTTAPGTTA